MIVFLFILNKLQSQDETQSIGCKLCAKYCPWDTIPMLDHDEGMAIAPSLTARSVCGQEATLEATS